jgi:class 3 adenylate cyclase
MAIRRAALLIADIGGYTRFMRVHRVNLAHAQDVITRLLEAVIDAAEPAFKLAKLEGDAAFFHAPQPETPTPGELAELERRVIAIRTAFIEQRERMKIDRICTCDGCTQVGDLKLKFVAHTGEVAFHRVKGRSELAGMAVIVLHRLLKNSVPVKEYVLLTGPALDGTAPSLREQARTIEEDIEGVGKAPVYYVDLSVVPPPPPPPPASGIVRLFRHIMMNVRAVPYIIGLRKACDAFHNMDEALGREDSNTLLPPSSSLSPGALPPASQNVGSEREGSAQG